MKINRPGLQVRHRKGYLAAPAMESDRNKREQTILELAQNPLTATGIGLTAQIDHAGANAQEVAVAIRVEPAALTLEKNGEQWMGLLDVAIVQSARDGTLFKSFSGAVGLTLTGERRDLLMKEGLTMNRTVTIRPDASQLRILVRDAPSGSTGSLIVPIDRLNPR